MTSSCTRALTPWFMVANYQKFLSMPTFKFVNLCDMAAIHVKNLREWRHGILQCCRVIFKLRLGASTGCPKKIETGFFWCHFCQLSSFSEFFFFPEKWGQYANFKPNCSSKVQIFQKLWRKEWSLSELDMCKYAMYFQLGKSSYS